MSTPNPTMRITEGEILTTARVVYCAGLPDGVLLGVVVREGDTWKGEVPVPGFMGVSIRPGASSFTAGHKTLDAAIGSGRLQDSLNRHVLVRG